LSKVDTPIPFILLTGGADAENIDREIGETMADCGVDAIVGKPVDIPDLLRICAGLLRKSRVRDN
jgi:response regulator RpfG family c-di-GMP phosphodiesterase